MSKPNEIRIRKDRDEWRQGGWTAVPNALLLRSDISWEAKGAFGWMSLAADDPEFEVDSGSLAAAGTAGRDKAQNVVRELERHGYLTRARIPGAGATPYLQYDLHPAPVDEERNTYTPSTAAPRKGAFSQRKPEKLNVQSLGDDQGDVDNPPEPDPPSGEAPEETRGVSPAQARKTERAGTARSGTARTGVHTYSSRKTSSSSSSSGATADVDQSEEGDEEEEESEEQLQGKRDAQTLLGKHARFKPGKYLSDEARAECEELIAQHLAVGWDRHRLGRYVRDWSAQAHNPSTWLTRQLRELKAPKKAAESRTDQPDDRDGSEARDGDHSQAHSGSQRSNGSTPAPASEEHKAAVLAELSLKKQPGKKPATKGRDRVVLDNPDRATGLDLLNQTLAEARGGAMERTVPTGPDHDAG